MTRTLLQQALGALHPQANRAFVEATKDALRSALAAPQPEPVAYVPRCHTDGNYCIVGEYKWDEIEEKPFGLADPAHWECAALYAAPPAAPAPVVPLTDADIDRIADAVPVDDIGVHITTWHRRFARAVLSAAPAVPQEPIYGKYTADDLVRGVLQSAAPAVPLTDTRKLCTCDGAGRGPGRACVVQAGGRLGELWKCAKSAAPAVPPFNPQAECSPTLTQCPRCNNPHHACDRGAAPAVREPLTDEQIDALWSSPMSADWEHREFARAIEAHHGIGGGGK